MDTKQNSKKAIARLRFLLIAAGILIGWLSRAGVDRHVIQFPPGGIFFLAGAGTPLVSRPCYAASKS